MRHWMVLAECLRGEGNIARFFDRVHVGRRSGRNANGVCMRRVCLLSMLFLGIAGASTRADAMPNFSRKLGVGCETCHTPAIPKLNETGFKFRAAGFRMPSDIGKEETAKKPDIGDYFAARIQARYDTQSTNQPNGAPITNCPANVCGPRTTTNAFSFMEATLYPLTGSWGKYFGSLSELSVSPEDVFEIENAYVRYVRGSENAFFTVRAGVFHPFEGFGASDRPLSNARTLFQTSPIAAGGRAIPYVFQSWGLDEAGVEVGGDFNRLSIRGAVLGGTMMRWEEESGAFLPFPAQTGPWKGANQAAAALGKPYTSLGHNTPDFSANATYILNSEAGGLSAVYYHGNVATPTHCSHGAAIGATLAGEPCGVSAAGVVGNTDFDFTSETGFLNHFDRVAFYGSYPMGKFLPMAGFQWGRDETPNSAAGFPAADATLTTFNSNGAFLDGAYQVNSNVTAGLRWDRFHPNTARVNTQWAITPYINVPLNNGLQFIAEYSRRNFQLDASHDRQNDTFQVRLIFIM